MLTMHYACAGVSGQQDTQADGAGGGGGEAQAVPGQTGPHPHTSTPGGPQSR